jgi:hypothetical protein
MGMGGKGDSKTENTIRYAPYLEAWHQTVIEELNSAASAASADNPYTGHTDLDFEAGFFGTGYLLSSFPSLYDIYGKFMAGLDIDVLYDQILEDTIDGPVINNLIAEEADRLDDEIEQVTLPRFEAGMRDVNSVMSSSFLIGKALIEANKLKAMEKFSVESRYRLLPVATERWTKHLEWNKATTGMYSEILKLYLSQKIDVYDKNLEVEAKESLWPFQAYQYVVQGVGAMSGATTSTETQKKGGGILGTIASVAGMAAMLL